MAHRLHLIGFVTALLALSRVAPAPVHAQGSPAKTEARMGGNAEHGRYIAEHVAMCVECHSGRDDAGNIVETQKYMGAPIPFRPPWPNDWALRAPRNRGLPGYDDAQAMRLLTEGSIGRSGAPLRRPMPEFRMTRDDAADVIAYLRSLR